MTRPITLEQACALYVNRFTMEHVPPWARRRPCDSGGTATWFYAPQFKSDREWYENTRFPGEEGHPGDTNACYTSGETWPLGQRLAEPYRRLRP